ncbi:MAG: PQQ-binding-like beta-propeller repeat protein [Anaerolineales bacterium]|nr:PQQ-binding-like beta-propeller repeat protein [Anaerolineales bacterium]
MNKKKLILVLLLALAALALSACSGQVATNNWPGLSVDGEHAYLATGSFVYAVDVKTGKQVWKYPEEASGSLLFYATPVLTDDGQLLIGSAGTNHSLLSLDPATGRENWAAPFTDAKGAWVASPLAFNNAIYAPNTDGFLYILNMSGAEIADPIELSGALWSAPVTDGNLLYVTSLDHHLHVVNPATGEVSDAIDLGGGIPGSPAVTDGGVFVGSFTTAIEFVQPNGEHEVIANAGNWIWGTPVLDNGTLYYADLSGNLFSLDTATKTQNWGTVKPDGPVVASLLVTETQIYAVAEDGNFIAVDRDGKIVWEKETGGKNYTTPALAGDLILVAPYQTEFALAAYDADGKQAWTFTPEK